MTANNRTFFITTVCAQRRPMFRYESNAKLLLQTIFDYRLQGRYRLHDFVIMPDHVHLLMTPDDKISLERAVQFVKGGFSFRLKSRFPVWQESFTNHRIRDQEDFERHGGYIRRNPVAAGLVERAEDYPYSSIRFPGMDPMPPGLKPVFTLALTRP